jgi:hypothetical protein
MSPIERSEAEQRWDVAEQLLREAERALRTPPRDAANGHARVQGAQAEVARLRQQHQGAVEAIRAARDAARTPDDVKTVRAILNEALDRFDRHPGARSVSP